MRVTTPAGTSAYNGADYYTYADAPAVTGVSPASGLPSGGAAVSITGTGFVVGATVRFGTTNATNVTVKSSTSIAVDAPAHVTGRIQIRVTTPAGTSAYSTADYYTYAEAPTVTGVSAAAGPTGGGNRVTVTGAGFVPGAIVRFGATPGTEVVTSVSQLTVTAPPHSAGRSQIRVTTPSGTSADQCGLLHLSRHARCGRRALPIRPARRGG